MAYSTTIKWRIPRHKMAYSTTIKWRIPRHKMAYSTTIKWRIPRHKMVYSTTRNGVFHDTKWRIPRHKMAYTTTQNGVFHDAVERCYLENLVRLQYTRVNVIWFTPVSNVRPYSAPVDTKLADWATAICSDIVIPNLSCSIVFFLSQFSTYVYIHFRIASVIL